MEKIVPFGFVFDLDTTINKNNEIDKDAIEMLKNILKTRENAPVMFISKYNLKETQKVVDEIEKRVGKGKMHTIVCSNNGAYITNGKVGVKNRFSLKEIQEVRKKVETYAPGSIIIYKTKDKNIREMATYTKKFRTKIRKGITLMFHPVLKKYKKFNIFTQPFSDKVIDHFASNEQILSIEVVAPKKRVSLLRKRLGYEKRFATNIDESINIANVSKWDAIKMVFKDNAKDVMFFGTNCTDKDCLLQCENVVIPKTTNKKLIKEVLVLQNKYKKRMFAINQYNHKNLLDYINNKRGSVANLKFDTRNIYDNFTKNKIKSAIYH